MDVIVTASSRPECLERTMTAFLKRMEYSGKFKFYIHEDFVFRRHSERSLKFIEKSGLFECVHLHLRPIGLGKAIVQLFEHVKTDFMFYLQDDWEFERQVPLDDIVKVMENYPDINQIVFNKYKTYGVINSWHFDERRVHPLRSSRTYTICVNNNWQLLPSVWRTEWMKKRYKLYGKREKKPEGNFTNSLGTKQQRQSKRFCERHIGSYIWGPIKDPRYVLHLGDELRMAAWRLEDGKPGGTLSTKEHDDFHQFPGLDYPIRPTRENY